MGQRRSALLADLREADAPVSAAEMAERTGLHLNTARFHLDALVEQGLAQRHAEERGTPGRPRIRYVATASDDPEGVRSYGLLAEMLVGLVRGLDPESGAAAEAGRAWGRHLVDRAAPSEHVDADEALARLDALMAAVGFAPETIEEGAPEVRLHHCPFLEVATASPEIVCAMHRGLIEGALGELGAPLEVRELQPWATPRVCVATLDRVMRDSVSH